MNLREKIKAECKNKNIDLTELFKDANINTSSYYRWFLDKWKPSVAAHLKVDEEEFFAGFEREIRASKKREFNEAYAKNKIKILELLKQDWLTMPQMIEITGRDMNHVNRILGSIKYKYIVDAKPVQGQKRFKMYHVTSKILTANKQANNIPITKLPKVISKFDLLTWGINQTQQKFESSHDLVTFAKKQGKQVFEFNNRGEVYYL